MKNIRLKLKQASAVLGVGPKDLQNLIQFGVVHPARQGRVYWFDIHALLEAKIAFYLKESLGSSSDLLARFTEALAVALRRSNMNTMNDIGVRSRPLGSTDAVEINIPIIALAKELESRLPLASVAQDLPRGRKRVGWKIELLQSVRKASAELKNISEEQILNTVREYRSGRKKLPEITVVARTKKKTA